MSETPPDPADLKFALAKFGDDAKRWTANQGEMEKAKNAADALDIDPLAFGPAVWLGVADKYREVKQMIVDRCGEGATEFGDIANKLIKARDEYDRDEQNNVHAINKVW